MKISNKREPQQIAFCHSSDIELDNFMKIYKKSSKQQYSFLANDTTPPSDNPFRFLKKCSNENLVLKFVF